MQNAYTGFPWALSGLWFFFVNRRSLTLAPHPRAGGSASKICRPNDMREAIRLEEAVGCGARTAEPANSLPSNHGPSLSQTIVVVYHSKPKRISAMRMLAGHRDHHHWQCHCVVGGLCG